MRKMRFLIIFSLVALFILLLSLYGCGSSTPTSSGNQTAIAGLSGSSNTLAQNTSKKEEKKKDKKKKESTEDNEADDNDNNEGGATAGNTGAGGTGNASGTVVAALPPTAPVGVIATASIGQNTINWVLVAGATSYNIYWSTVPSVNQTTGTKITGLATTSYTQTGLTAGTTYYYIITAVNANGESIASAQASGIPLAPPPPPAPLIHDVIVGYAGTILVSTDETNWTKITGIPITVNFYSVTYAKNLFIAVGTGGNIYTSPDGLVWTPRNSGTINYLTRVRWLGTQFVAVGGSGTLLTSPDGIIWTQRNTGTTDYLSSITWSNSLNLYVATGGNGSSGLIFTSPDTITWTSTFTTGAVGGSNFYNITWAAQRNEFVAIGGDPITSILYTSPDGINWTRQNTGTNTYLSYVMWDGAQYVIAGGYGLILTSTNSIVWGQKISGTANFLNSITRSISTQQFVIVGEFGTILKSTDGALWNSNPSGTLNSLSEMTCR